jgi:hypothetical protein
MQIPGDWENLHFIPKRGNLNQKNLWHLICLRPLCGYLVVWMQRILLLSCHLSILVMIAVNLVKWVVNSDHLVSLGKKYLPPGVVMVSGLIGLTA